MTTIHKAARPKKNYDDPTICSMVRRNGHRWGHGSYDGALALAHKNSRVRWVHVTCKLCLAKRRGQR